MWFALILIAENNPVFYHNCSFLVSESNPENFIWFSNLVQLLKWNLSFFVFSFLSSFLLCLSFLLSSLPSLFTSFSFFAFFFFFFFFPSSLLSHSPPVNYSLETYDKLMATEYWLIHPKFGKIFDNPLVSTTSITSKAYLQHVSFISLSLPAIFTPLSLTWTVTYSCDSPASTVPLSLFHFCTTPLLPQHNC